MCNAILNMKRSQEALKKNEMRIILRDCFNMTIGMGASIEGTENVGLTKKNLSSTS